ncbi:MAG: outer membrane protein assembly factor BamB family protein [Planctomycetota bacterium]
MSKLVFNRNNRITTPKALVLVLIAAVLFSAETCAEDWPQWRGPNRDGVWHEKGVVQKFDSPQLQPRWRAKIENGYSGPTVANGRVYVTDRMTAPTQLERVHCFDTMTGQPIWSRSYECVYKDIGYRNGPRASVTIDSNRAYSLGTMGHLYCFDAAKGSIIWNKDLYTEYKIRMPIWGIAVAPLIEKDLVIVQVGGSDNACIIAFDKSTGKEKWRALNDKASYSPPIVIKQAGKRVLVCWTAEHVVGLDPNSGRLYWQQPFASIQSVTTPVVHRNFLFVSSFFEGSLLLKLHTDKLTVSPVWQRKGQNVKETDSLHCCISTPVLQGDYIYGVDSYGELRCLDLHTGDRIWENLDAVPKARWANIHMVRNQDNIWMFNERGELIISKLSPKGFHEISRTKIINPTRGQLDKRGGVCWSHPAFAYKHVYIRNDEELLCMDLSAKD